QDSVNKLKPGLNEFLPYSFKSPGGGLALFSRLPIQDARGDTLNFNSYNLLATIEINQKPVQLIATHPVIPVKMDTFHRRNRHLDVIADFVKQETLPLILLGDFNLTPWSPYYRRFTKKTGLHNASLGYGIMATYPRYTNYVRYPKYIIPLINIPIDHCFVSQEFKVANYRVGNNANSDHAPIIADLVLSE
ncbi:MAG: endonuclease/exonuclease/phosphatase family protein, partial [Cyanobacteria bacterium P01_A01_bin.45]